MELTAEQEKKLASIARRMQKASNDIVEMGFTVYLSCHGRVNIMNGSSHGEHNERLDENVVYDFYIAGWDAGDW